MGLLDTLKRALGLERAITPHAGEAPRLSPDAVQRLQACAPGTGVLLDLVPTDGGFLLQVTEEPGVVAHPAFGALPLGGSDSVIDRLKGVELHVQDGRWQVRARVAVRARETPNPNSRVYLTDRTLAEGRVVFAQPGPGLPRLVRSVLARDDVVAVTVRADQLTVERERDQPWDPIDHAVASAIREHVVLCAPALEPASRDPRTDPLEAAVQQLLDSDVRPGLQADGGDIDLVSVEDGVVRVHLVGACRSCPASSLTLQHGVQRALLEAFPDEIREVVAV